MGISGKADFEDVCTMHHSAEEILSKYEIYASINDIIPLKIQTEKDLVAYYPYLVAAMYSSKEDGGTIRLTSKSYIDIEEEEHLTWRLNDLIRYYKKCKRKKIPFDKNEALKKINLFSEDYPRQYEIDLVNRVAEFGTKATIENIHDPMHDRMRKEWFDLMVESGWNEDIAYRWIFGWSRWLNRSKKVEDNNDNNGKG